MGTALKHTAQIHTAHFDPAPPVARHASDPALDPIAQHASSSSRTTLRSSDYSQAKYVAIQTRPFSPPLFLPPVLRITLHVLDHLGRERQRSRDLVSGLAVQLSGSNCCIWAKVALDIRGDDDAIDTRGSRYEVAVCMGRGR